MEKVIVQANHSEGNGMLKEWTKDGKNYGSVRVEQAALSSENGFINIRNRSTFITLEGKSLDLLRSRLVAGQPFPLEGKIVREESFTPFYEGQPHKINPQTKEDILVDNQKVYFYDKFVTNMNASDSLISANNVAVSENAPSVEEEA